MPRRLPAGPAAVLAGGLAGSLARAAVSTGLPVPGGAFPWATFLVNLGGSLLLGAYLARRQRAVVARWSLDFWGIGVFGSFTTFSAFSFEVVRLLEGDAARVAAAYAVASIVGGILAAVLGERLASAGR